MVGTSRKVRVGLSPRVRGNRFALLRFTARSGSIPASAGEPGAGPPRSRHARVYPRECGGTVIGMLLLAVILGLSPRVRGNRHRRRLLVRPCGSIPASAGEPYSEARALDERRVYPRECGGTSSRVAQPPASRGLSPRVRGNPRSRPRAGPRRGSIPASAGEPRVEAGIADPCAVYPRECGGTDRKRVKRAAEKGLSPRVRGNHGAEGGGRGTDGSIPASAGEPQVLARGCIRGGVYPRECGGTGSSDRSSRLPRGLSPRVRGNLRRRPRREPPRDRGLGALRVPLRDVVRHLRAATKRRLRVYMVFLPCGRLMGRRGSCPARWMSALRRDGPGHGRPSGRFRGQSQKGRRRPFWVYSLRRSSQPG